MFTARVTTEGTKDSETYGSGSTKMTYENPTKDWTKKDWAKHEEKLKTLPIRRFVFNKKIKQSYRYWGNEGPEVIERLEKKCIESIRMRFQWLANLSDDELLGHLEVENLAKEEEV